MTDEEQRQAWRAEWGELTDGSSYETWLENRLLGMQDLRLKSLHVADGKIDMVAQGDLVCIFAQCMAEMLDGEGAVNLVEYKVVHPVKGPLVLTLQRQFGKTPMDLLVEAKAERDDEFERAEREKRWGQSVLRSVAEIYQISEGPSRDVNGDEVEAVRQLKRERDDAVLALQVHSGQCETNVLTDAQKDSISRALRSSFALLKDGAS